MILEYFWNFLTFLLFSKFVSYLVFDSLLINFSAAVLPRFFAVAKRATGWIDGWIESLTHLAATKAVGVDRHNFALIQLFVGLLT